MSAASSRGFAFLTVAGLVFALGSAARAESLTMTVNYAQNVGTGMEYDETSAEVAALNNPASGSVGVASASAWVVGYTDPSPDPVLAGSTLTSVIVTVQYSMGLFWNGMAGLTVTDGGTLSDYVQLDKYTSTTEVTWDITVQVNSQPDPVATLNGLQISLGNFDLGGGSVTWSYTKVDVTYELPPNDPPERPSITSPVPDETDVDLGPTITASAFSDPNGDGHLSSDWEVYDDTSLDIGSRVASSLNDTADLTSIRIVGGEVTFEGTLSGETFLASFTEYWCRVRYRDDGPGGSEVSEWSVAVHFTTYNNAGPLQPEISYPSFDGQEDVARNVTILASAFSDPEGDAHGSSDWEIFTDASCLNRVAHSMGDAVKLESIETVSSAMVFEGAALAGRTNLAPLTDYWVVVTYRDEYGAASPPSDPRSFRTTGSSAPPAQASFSSPGPDAIGVALNPVLEIDPYSDPDEDRHATTDWELYADEGLALLVAYSTYDPAHLTSIEVTLDNMAFEGALGGRTKLEAHTEYWARARFRDDVGEWGPWSETLHFTTGQDPSTGGTKHKGCVAALERPAESGTAGFAGAVVGLALVFFTFSRGRRSTGSRRPRPEYPPRQASIEVHPPGRGRGRRGLLRRARR